MPGAVFAIGPALVVSFPDLLTGDYVTSSYTMRSDGALIYDFGTDKRWVINAPPLNYEVRFNGGGWLDFTGDRTIHATSTVDLRDKTTLEIVKSVTIRFVELGGG